MLAKIKRIAGFVKGYLIAKYGPYRSRNSILKRQKKLFNRLKERILRKSLFYKVYLEKGIENFPVINKEIFVDNFNTINTEQLDRDECLNLAYQSEKTRNFNLKIKNFSVGLSSGTSGNRGMFVTSDYEQALWAGYIIGKLLPFSFKKRKVAFLLRSNNNLYESSQGKLISFKFFDLFKSVEEIVYELDNFSPDILIAPAKILRIIADSTTNIKPWKIISVAEVLEQDDKTYIENFFSREVDQVYQCTEGFLATTCSKGNLHLNEDIVLIEKDWIDKASGRFSPIITDLQRSTQPVVRYRLDDVLIENKTACACGSSFLRIDAIEGRHDDILWYPRKEGKDLIAIFPDLIRRSMLLVQEYYDDYKIIQEKYSINIYIKTQHPHEAKSSIEKELSNLFSSVGAQIPETIFRAWSDENLMLKRRRIKCIEKPQIKTGL